MKIFKKLTKKKKIMIIVFILLIIILAIRGNIKAKQALLEENKIETEAIEKRTITKSVSATGNVTTTNSKEITSILTGSEIATVNVVEGQKISAGDVICTFDMSSVETDLSTAKSSANISDAQSNLSIESAQRNLEDAIKTRDFQIVEAQRAVESAKQAYDNAQNQLNTLNQAMSDKQVAISTAASAEETQALMTEISDLQASIYEQQMVVNECKNALDSATSSLDTITISADSNVSAMQDNLKNAELAAKSTDITQNSQLNTYEEQLKKGIVTSTVEGTVTAVNVKVGDVYTGTTIATINGTDEFIVEAEIDEYDIADIKTGMKAFIKTDATRDEELEGTVTYVAISPTNESSVAATTTNSNVTYKIQITLFEQNERLRLGMNAKISIVLDSKEDVWTVPYDTIHEREDGTKYIEILKDKDTEETEELDVEVGIEGTYYVQIIATSLKDGMEVVLPKQDNVGTSIEDLIMQEGPDAGI